MGFDSTALTVVDVDLSLLSDPAVKAPVYRIVDRRSWTGIKHTRIYAQILGLIESWGARWVVVDATGVGAGLASFLDRGRPGKVIPFLFNGSTKSELGWDLLGIVETGRFKDWSSNNGKNGDDQLQEEFFHQLELCQMTIIPGPEHRMRWGVPDGTRDPATGELVHDDLVLSAALVGVLDQQEWFLPGQTVILAGRDPLHSMDREGF
ncbi:MAG TPA: hypothetical protein VMT46_19425 [Anaerolineaceae bacterium]|nr:hypothetical protein [Anaerolineaceae bacterium]